MSKFLIFGIGAGLIIGFFKYIKSFLLWIKGGIENGDGKLENRDLLIAVFTLFCFFILVSITFWQADYPDTVIIAVFSVTTTLYGIKNISQSVIDIKNNQKNEDKKE